MSDFVPFNGGGVLQNGSKTTRDASQITPLSAMLFMGSHQPMLAQPDSSSRTPGRSHHILRSTPEENKFSFGSQLHPTGAMWSSGAGENMSGIAVGADEAKQATHDYQRPSTALHLSSSVPHYTRYSEPTSPTDDLHAYAFAPYPPISAPDGGVPFPIRNPSWNATSISPPSVSKAYGASKTEHKRTRTKKLSKTSGVRKPSKDTTNTNAHVVTEQGSITRTVQPKPAASPLPKPRSTQPAPFPGSDRPNDEPFNLAAAANPTIKLGRYRSSSTPHVGTPGETPEPIKLRTPQELQGGRNLARALGILGGREDPIGPGTSGFDFTLSSVIEAMHRYPGQVTLHRDRLLNHGDYASVFEADPRLDRASCNEAILAASAHTPPEGTYFVDLGGSFRLAVPLASHLEPSFKRGGAGTIPPEGLIRIASEMNVDMTHYRVDGKPHPVYSMGAPKQADIRLLGSTALTIVELAIMNWTRRFDGNGWTQNNIADLINRAYSTDAADGVGASTISEQIKRYRHGQKVVGENRGKRGQLKQQTASIVASPVTVFSCDKWTPPSGDLRLVDYYVRDLANGVDRVNFPSGLDKGVLTQVIEHVLEDLEEWADLKLSQIPWFVEHSELEIDMTYPSFEPGMENPDTEAFARHKADLRRYRETMRDYRVQQRRSQAEVQEES